MSSPRSTSDASWDRFKRIQWLNAYVVGLYLVAPLPFMLMAVIAGDALIEGMEGSPDNRDGPSPLSVIACCPSFLLVIAQFVIAVKAIAPLKEFRPRRYKNACIVFGLSSLLCQNTTFAMVPLQIASSNVASGEGVAVLFLMSAVGFLFPTSWYLALHYGLLWDFYTAVFEQRRSAGQGEQQEEQQMEDRLNIEQAYEDARHALRHHIQLKLDHECEDAREAKLPPDALKERIKGLVLAARHSLAEQEEALLRQYMAIDTFREGKPSLDRQLVALRDELLTVQSIRDEVERQLPTP